MEVHQQLNASQESGVSIQWKKHKFIQKDIHSPRMFPTRPKDQNGTKGCSSGNWPGTHLFGESQWKLVGIPIWGSDWGSFSKPSGFLNLMSDLHLSETFGEARTLLETVSGMWRLVARQCPALLRAGP